MGSSFYCMGDGTLFESVECWESVVFVVYICPVLCVLDVKCVVLGHEVRSVVCAYVHCVVL